MKEAVEDTVNRCSKCKESLTEDGGIETGEKSLFLALETRYA